MVRPLVGILDPHGPGAVTWEARVFFFYNSRMGCAGSLLVSIALTAVLLLALRACGMW